MCQLLSLLIFAYVIALVWNALLYYLMWIQFILQDTIEIQPPRYWVWGRIQWQDRRFNSQKSQKPVVDRAQRLPKIKSKEAQVATEFKGKHMARNKGQIQKDLSKGDTVNSNETGHEEQKQKQTSEPRCLSPKEMENSVLIFTEYGLHSCLI